jgi:hypothetical protein
VIALRVIPPWAAASGSTRTGLASTQRGCDRKTLLCASRVMAARYRVCKAHDELSNALYGDVYEEFDSVTPRLLPRCRGSDDLGV